METQLEIDFRQWLRELSRDVMVRYGRWLEDADGHDAQCDYCTKCVEQEVADRKEKQDPFTEIDGWDEARESDSVPRCDRCGCLIECSPTEELIRCDIEWLEDAEAIDAESAHSIWNWLSGMGSYSREKHWPQIKPHAERLLRAADREVVPDGVIRFVPACEDWYRHDTAWLSIYQVLARLLHRWIDQTKKGERGFLVDTTGRGRHTFQEFTDPDLAQKCVQELFEFVGTEVERGQFLRSIGYAKHEDLVKPMLIPDQRCHLPTFNVRGRVLKKSPNSFHPDAVVVTHAEMQLSSNAEQWRYRMYYDYKHFERSSWCVEICQKKKQAFSEFCEAVTAWQQKLLKPVGPEDQWRAHKLQQWDRLHDALEKVFYFEAGDGYLREKLTDVLMGVEGGAMTQHRIRLKGSVARTVFRWAKEAAKPEPKKKAKR